MLIRKLFRFENAHIVRGCSTRRCSHSIHGHSYKVELLLEAHALDNGQMVYDFGLLKGDVRDLIDAFDHAVTLWSGDDRDYVDSMRRHSERWVLLPVSPSAEQFSRVLFRLVDAVLSGAAMSNGEADVRLHSVIVHETETGYAQCFHDDAFNPRMGRIDLDAIVFSPAIAAQWRDPGLLDRLARDRIHSTQESR
ncbi:6-carboxytetrahydropterin synthase [Burkholderia sp. Bp9017]|uniref:6-carboxy-5,6,7,8-tetrahydropterin synthase n=1 Tax=Burkholderia anthina TaxID=179879 RepID=A0A7T7AKF2_9BURK|nr:MULTISPECIES: 6-pyruvoyl tetrahydropterin synthase family protein [Burkholderia]MBY4867397.1 6-carboxytetrahydropterin synthase [Burkholderia anthina]QQK05607.1 6-carboxytetrahydropterin synthase [Burkholderia anthina]RQZ19432.1 6-carboxytetrahydropterin synthase [Burkholderia sp. Bp9017]RQZ28931.1 6-carboxytetrahydropterin synthase [Burkholderia sp. Bp9016]